MTDRVPLTDLAPADRHREVGRRFGRVVAGTTDWGAPTPVRGWVALDVVRHLTDWFPGLLAAAAGVALDPVDVDGDPHRAWRRRYDDVQALLDDPDAAGRAIESPVFSGRLADMVDRLYTADVFMHTWDLARATGQDDRLDEAWCGVMLAGMQPIEDLMRSSGHYGPAVPVPAGAGSQERMLGFIGRDPAWRPR